MKGSILFGIARWQLAGLAAVLVAIAAIAVFGLRQTGRNLPYRDAFSENKAEEWTAYGGAWQVARGTVINRSDERGAKLVTGSSGWSNYRVESDLEMLGHAGDVGLILRVGDEEMGIDSYNGYYIGLRSRDAALVMGRADHGWLEAHPVPMPGGVGPSVWFRLNVVAVDCRIGAVATNLQTGQSAWGAFEEKSCVTTACARWEPAAPGGASALRPLTMRTLTRFCCMYQPWNIWNFPKAKPNTTTCAGSISAKAFSRFAVIEGPFPGSRGKLRGSLCSRWFL